MNTVQSSPCGFYRETFWIQVSLPEKITILLSPTKLFFGPRLGEFCWLHILKPLVLYRTTRKEQTLNLTLVLVAFSKKEKGQDFETQCFLRESELSITVWGHSCFSYLLHKTSVCAHTREVWIWLVHTLECLYYNYLAEMSGIQWS